MWQLRYFRLPLFIIYTLSSLRCYNSIVNPNQESANLVIVMRPEHELGPRTWKVGVDCLHKFTKIFLNKREVLTRAQNILITSAINMSTPAYQIQEGYLKLMNEAVSDRSQKQKLYQLRVIFDAKPYVHRRFNQHGVIYTDFYVLIVDSVERLKSLMRNYVSRMVSWNPGARFLILFNNVDAHDAEHKVAMEIFNEMLQQYYAHRVGILYATADTEYSFTLMDYYNKQECRKMQLREVATCRDGTVKPNINAVQFAINNFINEINLSNCTFHMCASIYAPFVEEDCVSGIELHIVDFIRDRLKFQIEQNCTYEGRGVLENGNWSGLLGKLNERYCDYILGGFYPDNEVIETFWSSDCYLYDSHTWFIKLADPRPPWKALYAIFQNETWLCFIVILFITWIFWYFFVNMLPEPRSHKDFSVAGINAMAVSICVAVAERPECAASRIFFLALSVYGLNVVALYTSQLISVFTNPGYLHQIDTLEEVVEAGIPFGGLEESRDWFENNEDMWIFDMYNYSTVFEPYSDNLLAVKKGLRVIMSSRMFILQNKIADEIFPFPKNVFSSPLQMIMKPGFPLLYEFNWLIRYMRDAGIFQKIDDDFRYNNTYLNRIAKMRPDFHESVIVLTTDHLQGPFAILIFGIISSTFTFFGELFVFWICTPCMPCCRKNKNNAKLESKQNAAEKKERRKTSKQEKSKKSKTYEDKKSRNKRNKRKEKILQKQKVIDDIETYDVNVIRSIRFTPLKRRHFVSK